MSGRYASGHRAELGGRDLGTLLREAPVPVEPEAERRGLELVLAAQVDRTAAQAEGSGRAESRSGRHGARPSRRSPLFPRPSRRGPLPRLAAALAAAALLGALLLTPAWAAVRDWVGDVFESAPPPRAQPGLTAIPGGGRLLVQSARGPWVVRPDGSRHLLGDFGEASWSPRGLYVLAVRGDELSALSPDGEPRWLLRASAPVSDPRWSPSGELVAYRAGGGLRLVAGDGSEDRPLDDSVAPLAPAWAPTEAPRLAYVDARGTLRLVAAESGRAIGRAKALPGIDKLEWARRGRILEASPGRLRLRLLDATEPEPAAGLRQSRPPSLPASAAALGKSRSLPLPADAVVVDAALSPDGRTVAAIVGRRLAGSRRSEVVLFGPGPDTARRLLAVPGQLTELAWSPHGDRLLLAWPKFDEWLFLPTAGRREGRALSGISRAFDAAGRPGQFPTIDSWCCHAGARTLSP